VCVNHSTGDCDDQEPDISPPMLHHHHQPPHTHTHRHTHAKPYTVEVRTPEGSDFLCLMMRPPPRGRREGHFKKTERKSAAVTVAHRFHRRTRKHLLFSIFLRDAHGDCGVRTVCGTHVSTSRKAAIECRTAIKVLEA
jgi:hypothetical protein